MAYLIVISLHAIGGIVCFIAGCELLIRLEEAERSARWFSIYAWGLGGLIAFLIVAVAVHWRALPMIRQAIDVALIGLALYMAWRARAAWAVQTAAAPGWRAQYADDIGLTLISLFDGFAIVTAIDLSAPGWLVAAVAVLGVLVGQRVLARVKAGTVRSA